jgi:hypothetical protein
MYTFGTTISCSELTWENIHDFIFRFPSETTLLPFNSSIPISFTLQRQGFKGVRVYNQWGELCGQVLSDLSLPATIFCQTSQSNIPRIGGNLIIQWVGGGGLIDLPSSNLSPKLPYYIDSLYYVINQGVMGTVGGETSGFTQLITQTGLLKGWVPTPDVPNITPTTGTGWISLNYTLQGVSWDDLALQIHLNNTYPFNYPLATKAPVYQTSPINYQDSSHLDYLYRIWSTWLFPRQSSERIDCKTFGLGDISYDLIEGPVQYWWQLGEEPDYVLPPQGEEGGCLCDEGYSLSTFCSTCIEGYGPLTPRQLTLQQEYWFIYPPSSLLPPYPYCHLPFSPDPIPGGVELICSGHGSLKYSNTSLAYPTTLLSMGNKQMFSICSSWITATETYTKYGTVNILSYTSPWSRLLWLGEGEFYLNETLTLYDTIQYLPPIIQTLSGEIFICTSSLFTLNLITPKFSLWEGRGGWAYLS